MTTEQRASEISGLIGTRVTSGSLTNEQRARLNALVAAEAGISEQDAAQRVQAYEAEAQRLARETEERARSAADAAATGTAAAAFWIFAALLLGAIAAIVGARKGARNLLLVGAARRRTV
jgi:CHASE3 domain sensor protein